MVHILHIVDAQVAFSEALIEIDDFLLIDVLRCFKCFLFLSYNPFFFPYFEIEKNTIKITVHIQFVTMRYSVRHFIIQ